MKTQQYESFHKKNKLQKRIIRQDNFTYHNVLSVLSSYLFPNISILDLGCGVGTLSFYIAQHGCEVLGLDVSRRAINLCKENAKQLDLVDKTEFLAGDFTTMNLKRKFDLILFSEVIEHLKDDKGALSKIYKLLKIKGFLILSTPSSNAPLYKLGFVNKFDKKVGHLRRYFPNELISLCEKTGFQVLEIRKTESVLRNSLFIFSFGDIFVHLANKISLFGRFITFIDNIFLRLFGESQLILIGKKKV